MRDGTGKVELRTSVESNEAEFVLAPTDGSEGFRRLSHAKGIYEQGRLNTTTLLRAPFGKMADRILSVVLR